MHKNILDAPKKRKDPSKGTGKVAAILQLHLAGQSAAEIIGQGYNKVTVYRQINEYKKLKAQGLL